MNVSSKVILTLSQPTAILRDHLDRLYVCVFLCLLVSFNAIYPGFSVMKEQYRMLTLLTLARRLTFCVVLFTMKKKMTTSALLTDRSRQVKNMTLSSDAALWCQNQS